MELNSQLLQVNNYPQSQLSFSIIKMLHPSTGLATLGLGEGEAKDLGKAYILIDEKMLLIFQALLTNSHGTHASEERAQDHA